jgi:diguanylate cyclase (GGDEF)-like protein
MTVETLHTPPALGRTGPMDTSRLLLSLLELANETRQASLECEVSAVDWVVCPWTLKLLMSALSFRDEATVLHSRRVALLAAGIATHLGWEDGTIRKLEAAALMHDIGKLGIPDHILHKPARLTEDEQEYVLLHHHIAVDLMQACRIDSEIIEVVWSAHTHGRTANEEDVAPRGWVSQGARLLAVADAYDSLRNDQAYRKGKTHEEAMRLLNDRSGKSYDRNIVATLQRWITEEGQAFLAQQAGQRLGSTFSTGVDERTVRHVNDLTHIFSFLYLLETLYDGFCLIDEHSNYVVWNHGLQQVTGLQPVQMIGESYGRKLLRLEHAQGKPIGERECPLLRAFSHGVPNCHMYRVEQRRTASWTEVEVQTLPLIDAAGNCKGAAMIFRETGEPRRQQGRYHELQLAARRDPLTGVGNRGEMESRLQRMFAALAESGTHVSPFSLIFLDLDHFKSVNDTFGHAVGDRVLVNLARLCSDELYSGETVCRFGGEEFVVLCPETRIEDATKRAERLRVAIQRQDLAQPQTLKVTASFGVAQVEAGDTMQTLVERADQALYDAKKQGRNRVCVRQRAKEAAVQQVKTTPFVHVNEFPARVAADMVMFKLSGFVDDADVRIVKVSPNRIELKVGSAGWLGGWGKTADKQPVRLEIDISEPKKESQWDSEYVTIKSTLTPLGSCRSDEVFQARALQVVQEFRSYFAVT